MDSSSITPELLEANPTLALVLTLFSLFVGVMLTGVLATWSFLGLALFRGQSILPVLKWTPRPWGLSELVIAIILLVVSQFIAVQIGIPLLGFDTESIEKLVETGQPPMSLAALVSAGYLLSTFLLTLWIVLRFQTSAATAGWTSQNMLRMIGLGLGAGFATLPAIFVISGLVNFATQTEYDHPIFEAMADEANVGSFLLASFAAVVVAPIAEEFLFRVVLQGWLQSLQFVSPLQALFGRESLLEPRQRTSANFQEADSTDPSLVVPMASELGDINHDLNPQLVPQSQGSPNPYATPVDFPKTSATELDAGIAVTPPLWPTFVSGTLFGLAHFSYGLSFIPLIVLGIVLGLLYRATQSIWPCIIVHFMLNASSMVALGVGVYIEKVVG